MRALIATGLALSLAVSLSVKADNPWTFDGPESPIPFDVRAANGRVAFGPDGEIYYAVVEYGSSSSETYFLRSTNFGESWSRPRRLNTDAAGTGISNLEALISDTDGTLYAFFQDSRGAGPFFALRVNISFDRGATWLLDDVEVYDGNGCGNLPSFSEAINGEIHVVCYDRIVSTLDHGLTWTTPLIIDPNAVDTRVSTDGDGNVCVAYSIIRNFGPPSLRDAVVNVSHDYGATWPEPPLVLGQSIQGHTLPRVRCQQGGHILVVWTSRDADDTWHVYSAYSSTSGSSFFPSVQLDDQQPIGGSPEIAANCDGGAFVSWPSDPVRLVASNDYGSTWSPPTPVHVPMGWMTPRVGIACDTHDRVFVSYSLPRPYARVWMNVSTDRGLTFPNSDISVSELNSDISLMACDNEGHVAVVHENFAVDLTTFLRIGHAQVGSRLWSGSPPQESLVVPPEGGRIPLAALVRNHGISPLENVPVALDLVRSDESIEESIASKLLRLGPEGSRSRSISRTLPGSLPMGMYRFRLHVGPPINDSSYLCVVKM